VKLETRIYDLCPHYYRNLTEMAHAMGISFSEVYRVRQGKRHINEAFILGAMRAFPEYKLGELFYVEKEPTSAKSR